MRPRVLVCLVALLAGCGGGAPEPRPVATHEDAGVHLRRIGVVWGETTNDEGFLEGDPNRIAFFRVATDVKLTLLEDGRARQVVRREEEFRTTANESFHCVAEGALETAIELGWKNGEVNVVLDNRAARLPRSCKEPGFPVREKDIAAARTRFVLRSDRLIAIEPARARDVLLPIR